MADIVYNENGINYGVTSVSTMYDLIEASANTRGDTPVVIKVDGKQVGSVGTSGLVLKEDGSQDHFEINVTL